jgi:hypothetical protein
MPAAGVLPPFSVILTAFQPVLAGFSRIFGSFDG